MSPIDRAIDALTYDHIEADGQDRTESAPLISERSIGNCLRRMEGAIGAKGSLLFAIAESIDEALLALEEAKQAREGETP